MESNLLGSHESCIRDSGRFMTNPSDPRSPILEVIISSIEYLSAGDQTLTCPEIVVKLDVPTGCIDEVCLGEDAFDTLFGLDYVVQAPFGVVCLRP